MSAARLREAARLMRARAEAATPGRPWCVVREDDQMYVSAGPDERGDIAEVYEWSTGLGNPEHIASWHPAVALAVADWLDMQAGCVANYGPNAESPWVKPHTQMALAVANAYLGANDE